MQDDGNTGFGGLKSGFATRETGSDDVNGFHVFSLRGLAKKFSVGPPSGLLFRQSLLNELLVLGVKVGPILDVAAVGGYAFDGGF
jgi:hypothetical protein